jgi:hypothetical protein
MAGWVPKRLYKGCHHLNAAQTTECADADTYYKITGTWVDGTDCNQGFTYDGTGKLTYNGQSGVHFLFNGQSDVEASKVCEITYALYKNGVIVTGAETPHSFHTANQVANIGITNIFPLQQGDYLEVYCKSDTAATDIISNTLMITFLGDI